MKVSRLLTALLVLFPVLTGVPPCLGADPPVFSGPQIGERLTPFESVGVLRELQQKKFDLVSDAGTKPIVIVFMHKLTRPSAAVTRAVMKYVGTLADHGVVGGVVFLSDDATTTEALIRRAAHALPTEPIGISVDGGEGPGAYGLNRNMTLTVLVGKNGRVTANFPLVQPSVQADAPKIGEAISRTIGQNKTPTLAQMGVTNRYATPARMRKTSPWKKHVVYSGEMCQTAVGGDFTGNGRPDVICNAGGTTRLLVAPDWQQITLDTGGDLRLIHSETMDVDRDGDLDFIGCRYQPGRIVWFECPEKPLSQRWQMHLIDDQVNGIHGLLTGDVDRDGIADLLANSAQPTEPFPDSLVWYRVGDNPTDRWDRHVLAQGDAPGLSHYLGLGDVNGDGRPDVASAAKGGPMDKSGKGNWFAWWEAPEDPTQVWSKHLISDEQPGATNIHPADVNGDGKMDFIASRGHDRGVVWLEGPNWQEHEIHTTLFGPHCLAVSDIDADGDIDAATCAKDDKIAAWFENDGKGNFATHVVGTDQAAYDIRAIDMDSDQDLDLLVAGQSSANVVWYENPIK